MSACVINKLKVEFIQVISFIPNYSIILGGERKEVFEDKVRGRRKLSGVRGMIWEKKRERYIQRRILFYCNKIIWNECLDFSSYVFLILYFLVTCW